MSDPVVLRYASRRVGLVVIAAVAILVLGVLQAGVLRDLFVRTHTLRVILPEDGLSGLIVGSPVQILGTDAGQVTEIVIRPDERLYAQVSIDRSWEPFVRRDSTAVIRKQFGIAGAAFLEIGRGRGEPLDWEFAVLEARSERSATDNVGQLVDDVRARVDPIIDAAQRITLGLAEVVDRLRSPQGPLQAALGDVARVTGRLARGEGAVGRLLADDTVARELATTLVTLNATLATAQAVVEDVKTASRSVARTGEAIGGQLERVPAIVDGTAKVVASTDRVLRGVERSLPQLDRVLRQSGDAAAALPVLLAQTQATLAQVERLLIQLQGSWLLGGGGGGSAPPPRDQERLSPLDVRP